MSSQGVTYLNVAPRTKRVLYEGSDTLAEGYPLCYNMDYGTAATATFDRLWRVEKPSTTNNMYYAGVVAPGGNLVGPCWLTIYLPRSLCNVYTNQNCVINSTVVTFDPGQYRFAAHGFRGAGSGICMQTVDRSSTPGLVLCLLDDDGEQSGGSQTFTPTAAGGAETGITVGGVTRLVAQTLAANSTYTLADGTYIGQRKAFYGAVMTTNDFVITITTPYEGAGSDTCTIDAAAEYLFAQWNGKAWHVEGSVLS